MRTLNAGYAPFPHEAARTKQRDRCFFALSGDYRELDPSFPYVKHGIRSVTLGENSLFLFHVCDRAAHAGLGEEGLRAKLRQSCRFHSGLSLLRNVEYGGKPEREWKDRTHAAGLTGQQECAYVRLLVSSWEFRTASVSAC